MMIQLEIILYVYLHSYLYVYHPDDYYPPYLIFKWSEYVNFCSTKLLSPQGYWLSSVHLALQCLLGTVCRLPVKYSELKTSISLLPTKNFGVSSFSRARQEEVLTSTAAVTHWWFTCSRPGEALLEKHCVLRKSNCLASLAHHWFSKHNGTGSRFLWSRKAWLAGWLTKQEQHNQCSFLNI